MKIYNKNLLRMKLFNIKFNNGVSSFDLRTNEKEKEKYYDGFSYREANVLNNITNYLVNDLKLFESSSKIEELRRTSINEKKEIIINIPNSFDVWVECFLIQNKETDKITLKIYKISKRIKKIN